MVRQVAVIAAFLYVISASPISTIDYVPAVYSELIPSQLTEFTEALSEADEEVLTDLGENYNAFEDGNKFGVKLKAILPGLEEKVDEMLATLGEKIDDLGDESKNFIKEVGSDIWNRYMSLLARKRLNLKQLGNNARIYMDKFKSLSDDAKENLQEHFPMLTSFFKNGEMQKLADVVLAKD